MRDKSPTSSVVLPSALGAVLLAAGAHVAALADGAASSVPIDGLRGLPGTLADGPPGLGSVGAGCFLHSLGSPDPGHSVDPRDASGAASGAALALVTGVSGMPLSRM